MSPQSKPTVLVLTNERDFAADRVIERILERETWFVERLNAETIEEGTPSWALGDPALPSRVESVWLRQFLPEARPQLAVKDVDDFLVMREQWRARLELLTESKAKWVNPLFESRRAENKLIQLREAGSAGLPVLPTLLTNHRGEARDWSTLHGHCIVKMPASGYFAFSDNSFAFTTTLEEALEFPEEVWKKHPVIVQRRVLPRLDVRVFVVGERVFGASATVDGPDWRLQSHLADWEPWPVPDRIARASRNLVNALGLRYGALDFACDETTSWFLECNPAGEFAFVDRPLDLGITDALVDLLCG